MYKKELKPIIIGDAPGIGHKAYFIEPVPVGVATYLKTSDFHINRREWEEEILGTFKPDNRPEGMFTNAEMRAGKDQLHRTQSNFHFIDAFRERVRIDLGVHSALLGSGMDVASGDSVGVTTQLKTLEFQTIEEGNNLTSELLRPEANEKVTFKSNTVARTYTTLESSVAVRIISDLIDNTVLGFKPELKTSEFLKHNTIIDRYNTNREDTKRTNEEAKVTLRYESMAAGDVTDVSDAKRCKSNFCVQSGSNNGGDVEENVGNGLNLDSEEGAVRRDVNCRPCSFQSQKNAGFVWVSL